MILLFLILLILACWPLMLICHFVAESDGFIELLVVLALVIFGIEYWTTVVGVCIAVGALCGINWLIFKANQKRYITPYLFSLPISAMIVAFVMAWLTGSGFTATQEIHTQQPYWYFWTQDVVSYQDIPTIWREMLQTSLWISLCIAGAFAIEWLVRSNLQEKLGNKRTIARPA